MQKKIIIPLAALLALCATAALAQDGAPPPDRPAMTRGDGPRMRHFNKAEMAKHLKQMCGDRYARTVGRMAYLETRLSLTDQQKPAFERWKDLVVASAKARADKCAAFTPPEKPPTLAERMKREETMLEARLSDLKAQMPALETLSASLTADQQRVLVKGFHRRGPGPREHRGFMRRGPGGPGMGAPPPAPQPDK